MQAKVTDVFVSGFATDGLQQQQPTALICWVISGGTSPPSPTWH